MKKKLEIPNELLDDIEYMIVSFSYVYLAFKNKYFYINPLPKPNAKIIIKI